METLSQKQIRSAVSPTIGAGVGALVSGGITVAMNLYQGKDWDEGLGR